MSDSNLDIQIVEGVVVASLRCQDYTDREEAMLTEQVPAVAKDHDWRVALDVSEFMNLGSPALGGIIRLNIRCRRAGGGLVLFGLRKETLELLVITHLDRVLSQAPDQQTAVGMLASGPD